MVTFLRPASLAEAVAAIRDTHGSLRFRGGGTKTSWEQGHGDAPGTLLATTALHRILDHQRDDFTVTVEAGLAFADLQAALRPSGQWVPLDPPTADAGATVGGVFATDEAGPRRLRHGTLRDLVIGITTVLPDGTLARAGGRVIKNVAGYDLARLHCGAFGTVGLVAELTIRLAPLPAASRTLRIPAAASRATSLAADLLAGPAEPGGV
ncbi:MAG: FAD-binding oxidoreductase [Acidimicrobiia bacterium]